MEDPAILRMNLDHFRRLLEIEADSTKRQTIFKLMAEMEEKLRQARPSEGLIGSSLRDAGQPSSA